MAVDPLSIAITVAINAASMAMTMMNKTEGPRLQDLSVTVADYGTPLVNFYGTSRVECPCIYAEEIREEKDEQKGKSGKYAEYRYYGTWAVFLADHEIERLLKLWLDRHIAYDTTGTNPVVPIIPGIEGLLPGGKMSEHMRIYLGTSDQEPDPRMVATIEAEEGAGRAPAYLDVAYIMFEEAPLEKFGNRLPQVSALITRVANASLPYEQQASDGSNTWFAAFGGAWMVYYEPNASTMEWWSLPSRTRIGTTNNTGGFGGSSNVAVAPDGTAYFVSHYQVLVDVHIALYITPPMGATTIVDSNDDSAWFSGPTRVFDINGSHKVMTGLHPTYNEDGYMDYGQVYRSSLGLARDFCQDDLGNIWTLYQPQGSSDQFTISGPDSFVITGSVTRSSADLDAAIAYVAAYDHFAVVTDGRFYTVDRQTGAIKTDVAFSGTTINFTQNYPNATSFWDSYDEVSLEDGSVIRSVDPLAFVGENVQGQDFYDPYNHAMWNQPQFADHLTIRFLDRATGGGWTLGAICADVARKTGMEDAEFNFTALDQNIPGYAWTLGPAKEILAPLLELHDSDIRPHAFIQQGLKRGQPLTGDTITTEWMVTRAGETGGHEALYAVPIVPETQLPRRIVATFADPDRDYQPNTVSTQRNQASVKSRREMPFDLTTYTSDVDTMLPLIERGLRRFWIGAVRPEMVLSPKELLLEPGDVRMVSADGDYLRCRLTGQVLRADRAIECRWELDGETPATLPDWEADVYASLHDTYTYPGDSGSGRPPDTVPAAEVTKGFIIDVALLFDADDQTSPFAYVAGGPYADGFWPGASVWAADENAPDLYVADWAGLASNQGARWGYVSAALPDALTEVIDEASEIEVFLPAGGTLSSVTREELLANQSTNLALVGEELIQFRDAELTAANTYTLTGLIRGVRGTEWATAGHAAGDRFVLINASVVKRTLGASEIADTDYYKFVTHGAEPAMAEAVEHEFEANAHRPLSPAHVTATRETDNDWAVSWSRRTRIGGSAVNGRDVPLGESSESYELEIMNGETVKRTITATSESATYTSAQQIADWGEVQYAPHFRVRQVSPTLNLDGFSTDLFGNPHRYWRLYVDANNGNAHTMIGELELRTAPGGANLAGDGTASAGGAGSNVVGSSPSGAFDNTLGTQHRRSADSGHWLDYDFGEVKGVSAMAMRTATGASADAAPKDFRLAYSDDGVTYTVVLAITGQTGWGSEEIREYAIT